MEVSTVKSLPRLLTNASRNFGILIGFFIFFSLAYIFASEYFSLSPSKGEVLVFRQGYRQRQSKSRDEESADVGVSQTSIPPDTPATSLPGTEKMIKIQRQTAVFHWKDLCYDINIKGENRRILDRVNGWVKPGTLTALMVSGMLSNDYKVNANAILGCYWSWKDNSA